ncbi:MAG: phosphatase PAP2 family protein [Actinobacteria bacterium]|nr:phosphatase PAP2 family protein [Actinomycetota bacterium]
MERVRHGIAPDGPPALPPPLRGPIAIVVILAALVLTVVAAQYAGEAAPGRLDTWAQTAVEGLLPEPGLGALVIDFVGEPLGAVPLVALLTAVCLALGRRRLAVVVVAGLGVTGVVTTVLKPVVGRTINGGFFAYPSGHTATATVFALIVMLLLVDLLEARTLPAVLLILSGAGVTGAGMALSQIALGAHYPTDTIGGFCAAMVVVPATAYLIDRLPEPRLGKTGKTGPRHRPVPDD